MKYLLTGLLILNIQLSEAQSLDQMFMYQVDGSTYEKKSYDKLGELKSSQSFRVGTIKEEDGLLVMPLTILAYNKNGELKDSSDTKYTCAPGEGRILMGIFPFAEFSADKTVDIDLSTGSDFYPEKWKVGDVVEDISFDMSIEGGVLGAFGTSTEVKIYARSISGYEEGTGNYRIIGKMQIKAYMLGLRISTIEYELVEDVLPGTGLVHQLYSESNGESFTITLKN